MPDNRRISRESMRALWRAVKSPLVYDNPAVKRPTMDIREQVTKEVDAAIARGEHRVVTKTGTYEDPHGIHFHGKTRVWIEVAGEKYVLVCAQAYRTREDIRQARESLIEQIVAARSETPVADPEE